MALVKNQSITVCIESLSGDGSGIAHYEGMVVFIPFTAVGDKLLARVVKVCKSYAYAIVETLLESGAERIPSDCPAFPRCGGCDFRHLSYIGELRAKQGFVEDALRRIGGLQVAVEPILPSPEEEGYRNKAQYPVMLDAAGHITAGFYAERSHRVIPCLSCRLQPPLLNDILAFTCSLLEEYRIPVYDENSGKGLIRHIYLRVGRHSGEVMVCLVCNALRLPREKEIAERLVRAFPAVCTVVLNTNTRRDNVILGKENRPLLGDGIIHDTLCGVPVELNPLSFYQVNTLGAEQLYRLAAQYAAPQEKDILLDLYCGAGTIGLSMARQCKELIGVEIIPEAVENARKNAQKMGLEHVRFLCADAGQAAEQLAAEGLRPDIVVLDPPRKGCSAETLNAVLQMAPRRIVMVSCNPATAARDIAFLVQSGYDLQKARPVDMFPRTKHVESVVLMSKK